MAPKSPKSGPPDPRPYGLFVVAVLWIFTGLLLFTGWTGENVKVEPLNHPILLALAVLFIIGYFVWFVRCVVNLKLVEPHRKIHPIWGVVCYFLPLINIVFPFVEMRRLIGKTFHTSLAQALNGLTWVWWLATLGFISLMTYIAVQQSSLVFESVIAISVLLPISALTLTVLIMAISKQQSQFDYLGNTYTRPYGSPSPAPASEGADKCRRARLPQKRS